MVTGHDPLCNNVSGHCDLMQILGEGDDKVHHRIKGRHFRV